VEGDTKEFVTIMPNYINKEYFRTIVGEFFEKNSPEFEESGYPHEPFVPYVMPNYLKAPVKVFYVGIDTLNWEHAEDYIEKMKNGLVDEWLQEHADRCSILDMYTENATTFFSLVARIQLMIRTGRYYESLEDLNDEELEIVNEVGYGNTYSIELAKTLEGEGWNDYDYDKYCYFWENAYTMLDGFHHIINAYDPDYIIVANGSFVKDTRGFQKLMANEVYDSEDMLLKVWEIEGCKTKVINVNHPNNRQGVTMEMITKGVYELLKYTFVQ